nr:metal-dependent hydrolase [Pseudomonas aeruginosa]
MSEFHHKLVQRKVRFDFSDTPLHWVPGEAEASQVMNVLHMLLPSGELWFCRLYNKAERLLCDYPLGQNRLTRALDGWWLRQRCAIIAAVEHFTCVLGKWVLEARELDRRGSDPVMLDLLRWHGAEEVEHRSVAHDLHVHLGGSFVTRQLTMLLVIAILVYLLADGTRTLLDQDPSLRGAKRQGFLRTWWRLGKQGLLPNLARTFRDVARYFNPWYHPEHEANTQEALEYLANSPAARRAANACSATTRWGRTA